MYLSALVKDSVSASTSLWFTRDFLCVWRYSIGSSTVMIWLFRSEFIRSIMEESVVDFPQPVGPVTSMSPRGFLESSFTISGSPSSWKVRTPKGTFLKAPATAPLCMKTLPLKRESPLSPNEKSSSLCCSNRCFWESVRML